MPLPFPLIGAVLEGFMNLGSNKSQIAIAQADLNEKKRAARVSEKLAKADRVDALGNRTYFDGEAFKTEVAPIIQAILNAQTKEQLETLRTDAPRARAASERKDERSKSADDAFTIAFREYLSKPQKSEEAFQAEDLFVLLDSLKQQEGGNAAALIEAVRSGLPSAITTVVKAGLGGSKPTLRSLKTMADRSGSQAYAGDKGSRTAADLGELQQLRSIADATDGANPMFSSANEQFSNQQENALQNLRNAVLQGSSLVGSGMQGVAAAKASQKSPFGAIFTELENEYGKSPEEIALRDWMMKKETTGAQLGTADNLVKLFEILKQNEGVI